MARKDKVDKARRRADRRAGDYQRRIDEAATPGRKLAAACDYLRAVATDLDDDEVTELAGDVLRMANGRNKR